MSKRKFQIDDIVLIKLHYKFKPGKIVAYDWTNKNRPYIVEWEDLIFQKFNVNCAITELELLLNPLNIFQDCLK